MFHEIALTVEGRQRLRLETLRDGRSNSLLKAVRDLDRLTRHGGILPFLVVTVVGCFPSKLVGFHFAQLVERLGLHCCDDVMTKGSHRGD
jgi:hypothetical protein